MFLSSFPSRYLGTARLTRFRKAMSGAPPSGAAARGMTPPELLECAVRDLHEAVHLDPGNVIFRGSLADALLLHGELGGAITQLEAATSAEPSAPNLRYKLGLLYCVRVVSSIRVCGSSV